MTRVRGRVGAQRGDEQRDEVVARDDLTDAVGRPDAQLAHAHRASLGSTSRPKTSIHSRWLRPTLCR